MENRYFYRDESTSKQERRLTVAYRYDKLTETVTYAASIYRKDKPDERPYKKSEHRLTASARLLLRPNSFVVEPTTLDQVIFGRADSAKFGPVTPSERWTNIEDQIRRQIRLNGVGGKRDGRFLNEAGQVVYPTVKVNNSFNQPL